MTLSDQYDGSADPFEGDRTIVWRSLPSNAQVTKASLTVTPAPAPGGKLFSESISFQNGLGDFGATKSTASGFVEVDFHKRRTLSSVDGTGVRAAANGGAHLQIDLGGLYVEINDKGAIRVPNDALFAVPSDGSLPGLTVSKFKLTPSPGVATVDVSNVAIQSVPSNLSVRIGLLSPFWSRPGDLSSAAASPDFSVVLGAYLAKAQVVNGFYVIPFVIHSDTLTRLRIDISIEFVGQTTLQPDGIKEVIVPFDFNTLPKTRAGVLSVELPPNARVLPGLTSAKVVGSFAETQIVHGVAAGSPTPPYSVHVAPGESQSQRIAPETGITASALDLLLAATTPTAQLTFDIRRDLDGKPDAVSVLSRPVQIQLPATPSQEPSWVNASLPTPFNFTDPVYWLVLASLEGEALWSTQPAEASSPGVQHTLDGGLSWHYAGALGVSGPLDASLRLRNKPPLFQVPAHVVVGSGNQAAPVNLDRFQPLGKVDFTIDMPELSDAFNRYLSTAASPCPQGEQLINGNFEQWVVSGNAIGTVFTIDPGASASALAATSDGQGIYLAGRVNSGTPAMNVIDTVCDEVTGSPIVLQTTDSPIGIAAAPAGDRAYVVGQSGICVVDTTSRAQIGATVLAATLGPLVGNQGGVFLGAVATSPDGSLLYLTFGSQSGNLVFAISTTVLEQAARGSNPLQGLQLRSAGLDGNQIGAFALSPDGLFIYVAASSSNTVLVIDTSTFRRLGAGVDVAGQPVSIDFTPDAKLALILTSEALGSSGGELESTVPTQARLHIVDTATRADISSFVVSTGFPLAILATPDPARAYAVVTSAGDSSLVPLDLRNRQPGAPVSLGVTATCWAITPQGDRIYFGRALQSAVGDSIVVAPLGARAPAEWFVTSDSPTTPAQVVPACVGKFEPFDRAAVFGLSLQPFKPNPVAAGLSQVIPAASSCSYDFRFFALAEGPDALAEIFWMDQNGVVLRGDSVEVQVSGTTNSPSAGTVMSTSRAQFLLHRNRLQSPAGAAQAEVRFSAPPGVGFAVAQVSLEGTPEAVVNGDLQLLQNGVPDGWTLDAQFARGVLVTPVSGGVRMVNNSPGNAELVQAIAVTPGQPFVWTLQARPVVLGPGPRQTAVELHWLKPDGSSAAEPIDLQLDSTGFRSYPASGIVPAAAARVEIHVQTPPATGLELYQVSFQIPPVVNVPLNFISQAPGELRVSRTQVTYDTAPVPPPAVPPQGLSTPTAPGSKPGDPPCSSFCSCCGVEQTIAQPKAMVTPAGRPMMLGSCRGCGSPLARPGGRLVTGAPVFNPATLPAPRRNAPGGRVHRAPVPLPPLTALPGIRAGRVRQLAEIGIATLHQLAEASPEHVAKALRGISMKLAIGFVEQARNLVASNKRSTAIASNILRPARPASQPVTDTTQKEN